MSAYWVPDLAWNRQTIPSLTEADIILTGQIGMLLADLPAVSNVL